MRLEILGEVLPDSLDIMTTRKDMDEIDLSGTKVPKQSATVNIPIHMSPFRSSAEVKMVS